jgi:prepilin-type N-terminal cleavage/methylation domain-containing protein
MIKEVSLKRSGFSLIELVFSIIIIAISLMSVPMLIGESNKANQYSLIQESVMAARTKLGNILTFQWDDNSTIINGSALEGLRVIDTLNGNIDLNRSVGTQYRVGHSHGVDRRKFDTTTNPVLAKRIGPDAGDLDDIDDFDGDVARLIASGGAGVVGGADYLGATELNITTTVNFLIDRPTSNGGSYQGVGARTLSFDFNTLNTTNGTAVAADGVSAAQSTNIKMIELSVANAFSDEPFIFRAFSSNLGGLKRRYSRDK